MINKYCTSFNDFLLFMQNIFFLFFMLMIIYIQKVFIYANDFFILNAKDILNINHNLKDYMF